MQERHLSDAATAIFVQERHLSGAATAISLCCSALEAPRGFRILVRSIDARRSARPRTTKALHSFRGYLVRTPKLRSNPIIAPPISLAPRETPKVTKQVAWKRKHNHPEGAHGGRRTKGHSQSAGSSSAVVLSISGPYCELRVSGSRGGRKRGKRDRERDVALGGVNFDSPRKP